MGRAGKGKPVLKAPDPTKFRKTRRQQRPTHVVGADSVKDMIFSRLQVAKAGPEYVDFSDRLDPVFYEQLTSERLITTYDSGFPERVWRPIAGRANETLRCTGYAMAALEYCGAAVRRRVAEYAKALSEWTPPPVVPGAPGAGGRGSYGMMATGVEW